MHTCGRDSNAFAIYMYMYIHVTMCMYMYMCTLYMCSVNITIDPSLQTCTCPVLKAGHPGVLVIVCFMFVLFWMGCIGSGFSSFTTNLHL